MRFILLTLIIVTAVRHSHAQLYAPGSLGSTSNPTTKNVGIGVEAPASKLDIQSDIGLSALRLQGGTPYGTYYFDISPFLQQSPWTVGYNLSLKSSNGNFTNFMSFVDSKVGIGTTNPRGQFDIGTNGDVYLAGNTVSGSGQRVFLPGDIFLTPYNGSDWSYLQARRSDNSGSTNLMIRTWNGGAINEVMAIRANGSVGIGTSTPTSKLTVAGDINSREIKVTVNAGTGPDYVFDPTYTLSPLDSIQSYITQNKHLPEVPSAKEMETNGVNLGEMNMLLLKKVEELTLYLIQQQKELQSQSEEIKILKEKIK